MIKLPLKELLIMCIAIAIGFGIAHSVPALREFQKRNAEEQRDIAWASGKDL